MQLAGERFQLVPPKTVPGALRESVDEERTLTPAKQHDRTEPAGPALTLARDSLLDDTAAEVGIGGPSSGAPDCIAQSPIRYSLAVGETREGFGLERAQSAPHERLPSFRVI